MCTKIAQLLLFMTAISLFSFAQAATYPMPKSGNDIIGQVYTVRAQSGDTPDALSLRHNVSLHEIMEANPGLKIGQKVRSHRKIIIPAQFILPPYRKGIVINMAELRLYYFTPDGQYVKTYPVAMGRDEWRTPTTMTSVVWKERDPVWNVPESIRAFTLENSGKWLPEKVSPGPDNPLGPYALHLGEKGYLIHGNNAPTSIGKYVSSGCIRMKNADIAVLFDEVKVGTPVYVIHHPHKIGWFNGVLYQESQVPVDTSEFPSALNQVSIHDAINQGLKNRPAMIDWRKSNEVMKAARGIPEPIGQSTSQHAENYESTPPQLIAETSIEKINDIDTDSSSWSNWNDVSAASEQFWTE